MKKKFVIRPVPPNFGDRFPDGDYTVGRGADPRGQLAKSPVDDATAAGPTAKSPKAKRTRKTLRSAAE